jgi:hypothetical protein
VGQNSNLKYSMSLNIWLFLQTMMSMRGPC